MHAPGPTTIDATDIWIAALIAVNILTLIAILVHTIKPRARRRARRKLSLARRTSRTVTYFL